MTWTVWRRLAERKVLNVGSSTRWAHYNPVNATGVITGQDWSQEMYQWMVRCTDSQSNCLGGTVCGECAAGWKDPYTVFTHEINGTIYKPRVLDTSHRSMGVCWNFIYNQFFSSIGTDQYFHHLVLLCT
ncbi:hypothetical protein GDO86_018359 [Hymenochirus boettgeri]|uniref:Uncharacterized protein n=1 Tax=Hymenochirus boettgeri TaxID=247094 RepID=A0A8T2IHD2_9PIPI|nr:hypothetical protein GDO86_018359 [Hymenochirus boettgeri]